MSRQLPIINDITMEDLERMEPWAMNCKVIPDGSEKRIPACTLEYCSEKTAALMEEADLVICKGMGNFESLYGKTGYNTFFLVVTKCDVVCDLLGTENNTLVLTGNREE